MMNDVSSQFFALIFFAFSNAFQMKLHFILQLCPQSTNDNY